jgi:ribosomal protein L24E
MKKCEMCGQEFEPHKFNGRKQIYCSTKCRKKSYLYRPTEEPVKIEKVKQGRGQLLKAIYGSDRLYKVL